MSSSGPPPSMCLRSNVAPAALRSRPANPSIPEVVGRDAELARIDALLADAAARDAPACCSSRASRVWARPRCSRPPGSARPASPAWRPWRRVRGTAGPRRAARPAAPDPGPAGACPRPQAAALGAALGWSADSAAADRFLIGAATLSLLAAAAERVPVLVLVDDLQWLDPESASALAFAARRLGPDAVGFLMATRAGAGRPATSLRASRRSASGACPPADATPSSPTACAGGARAAGRRTAGNPLALLEVARGLDHAQTVGAAPLPSPLPAGDRLRGLYRATLERRPPTPGKRCCGWRWPAPRRVRPSRPCSPTRAWTSAPLWTRRGRGASSCATGPATSSGTRCCAAPCSSRHGRRATRGHAAPGRRAPRRLPCAVWHRAASASAPTPDLADGWPPSPRRTATGWATPPPPPRSSAPRCSPPTPTLAAQRLAAATHDAFLAGDVDRVRGAGRPGARPRSARRRTGARCCSRSGMLEQYAGSVPRSVEHLRDAASTCSTA